jgi:hypothetical protein
MIRKHWDLEQIDFILTYRAVKLEDHKSLSSYRISENSNLLLTKRSVRGCLSSETMITLADGNSKKIKEIKPG